jgi:hypothetical protein
MQVNGNELDLEAFKKRLQAAREFEFAFDDLKFTCVLPTPIDERIIAVRNGERGAVGAELWRFDLAVGSVTGWNVLVKHISKDDKHGEESVPCTPEFVRILFSMHPEISDALSVEIITRRKVKDSKLEDDEKNSDSASPGSVPERKRKGLAASSAMRSPAQH